MSETAPVPVVDKVLKSIDTIVKSYSTTSEGSLDKSFQKLKYWGTFENKLVFKNTNDIF